MMRLVPKVTLKWVRNIVLAAAIASFSFVAGHNFALKKVDGQVGLLKVFITRDNPSNKQELDFSLFWRVWDTLEASYFDKSKIIDANLVYGAIKGMVAAVGDPYTVFLTPREYDVTREDLKGSFEGVGIQIGFRGQQLAVISPLPGTPAEEAGIKAGDFIAGIKDEVKGVDRSTVGMTLPEAVQLIRGPAGSTVTLGLLREDGEVPVIVDVVRRNIEVPSVLLSFVGDTERIAHVKLLRFGGETLVEWDSAILEILKKPNRSGIILDLRNNPGGFLQGSVDIGSEFLETGEVVVIEERGGQKTEFKVDRIGRLTKEPIVVLVNGGSASSSEILAGAMRDIKGTKLVGDTTFGKGSIQEQQELEGGVALHITTARWLTPKGTWVNGDGLEPDVQIEDDPETKEDEQLEKAVSILEL